MDVKWVHHKICVQCSKFILLAFCAQWWDNFILNVFTHIDTKTKKKRKIQGKRERHAHARTHMNSWINTNTHKKNLNFLAMVWFSYDVNELNEQQIVNFARWLHTSSGTSSIPKLKHLQARYARRQTNGIRTQSQSGKIHTSEHTQNHSGKLWRNCWQWQDKRALSTRTHTHRHQSRNHSGFMWEHENVENCSHNVLEKGGKEKRTQIQRRQREREQGRLKKVSLNTGTPWNAYRCVCARKSQQQRQSKDRCNDVKTIDDKCVCVCGCGCVCVCESARKRCFKAAWNRNWK